MESQETIFHLYHDIQQRTGGEIYIGIVGPVRTGKSTFIKHFMEELVVPNISDENRRARTVDELPQSGEGRLITTTEPKFIPQEAAQVDLTEDIHFKVRLIDCVGYLVEGAMGHMDGDSQRMVSTPWFGQKIPFSQAAQIGTDKVICEHSTIGIVMTTDGTIGEIKRENYVEAEKKAVETLKRIGKPFILLINSTKPYSQECTALTQELQKTYQVSTAAVNCEQLKKEDIHRILKLVLYEFPMTAMEFFLPAWVELLPKEHPVKADLIEKLQAMAEEYTTLKDVDAKPVRLDSDYISSAYTEKLDMARGVLRVNVSPKENYYYEMLSEMMGEEIRNEYELMGQLKNYGKCKSEYEKVGEAMENARTCGYGVVIPGRDEISVEQPQLIHNGNKYGVKIKATSPSVHMIKANIETEIAPIVGELHQAEDLIRYIEESKDNEEGIWNTTIFGKSVEQMVTDGIGQKTAEIGEECQKQLQDTMQKIVNDKNGGMVCIIL